MKRYHKSELQRELKEFCRNKYGLNKIITHLAAEINGTIMYLNEVEIRYLQVKCKMAPKIAFNELAYELTQDERYMY